VIFSPSMRMSPMKSSEAVMMCPFLMSVGMVEMVDG
jgi:hypothetical protein